jgi:murein DD-endopeptidase MepM/ murein hydrolase activator NlpD
MSPRRAGSSARPAKLPPVPSTRRASLFVAALGAAALVAGPVALGQNAYDRKYQIDARISSLQSAIQRSKEQEGVLSSEIAAASTEIDSLESDITVLSDRLAVLERELAAHRARLARLEARFEEQTRHLIHLKRQLELAQQRLEERLVQIYQSDEGGVLEILLQVESLSELIEQVDYVTEIGRQDRAIVDEITRLKREMRLARERTAEVKAEVAKETAALAEKTEEQRAARAALLARQAALSAAVSDKRGLLSETKHDRHEAQEDLSALQAASAALAAQIRSAQGSSGGSTGSGVSASGLIWPVSGVVTSGFGWRWGRMHEGIDISAPTGTAVHAAASGTVIFAGWMGGYGQLIVIDHGNGLATAYAHLSSIWIGGGSVSQGQAIGAVGCTGSCTGPHLHFEVRVNGSAVDPMGYL